MADNYAAPRIPGKVRTHPLILHNDLLSRLHYDPITGIWTWMVSFNNGTKKGDQAGDIKPNGYRYIGVCGVRYLSSRLAWFYMTGAWPEVVIDHKNLITDDDRWDNLRPATQSQNLANTRKRSNNTTGFKGVTRNGAHGFMAQITVNLRNMYLGTFRTPEEAHEAYKSAAFHYFGEFKRNG